MSTITGTCCCGRIEITIPSPPADSLSVCHCTTCRKSTGALGEYCLKVKRGDVKTEEGSMKVYQEVGSSGKTISRLFCPECGSRTFDRLESEPEWYYVQAETKENWAKILRVFIAVENARILQYYSGCSDVFLNASWTIAGLAVSLGFSSSNEDENKEMGKAIGIAFLGSSFSLLSVALVASAYGKVETSKTRHDWWAWLDHLNDIIWSVAVWNILGLLLLGLGLEFWISRGICTVPLVAVGAIVIFERSRTDKAHPDGLETRVYMSNLLKEHGGYNEALRHLTGNLAKRLEKGDKTFGQKSGE